MQRGSPGYLFVVKWGWIHPGATEWGLAGFWALQGGQPGVPPDTPHLAEAGSGAAAHGEVVALCWRPWFKVGVS